MQQVTGTLRRYKHKNTQNKLPKPVVIRCFLTLNHINYIYYTTYYYLTILSNLVILPFNLILSPIGAGTILGICTIPAMVLCVQPICVLCCGLWCCVMCYVLHSYHNPYTK